jgi:hypothetical protein
MPAAIVDGLDTAFTSRRYRRVGVAEGSLSRRDCEYRESPTQLCLRRTWRPPKYLFDTLVRCAYIHQVSWEVEGTNEFSEWFDGLNDAEQASVIAVVDLLEEHGATL